MSFVLFSFLFCVTVFTPILKFFSVVLSFLLLSFFLFCGRSVGRSLGICLYCTQIANTAKYTQHTRSMTQFLICLLFCLQMCPVYTVFFANYCVFSYYYYFSVFVWWLILLLDAKKKMMVFLRSVFFFSWWFLAIAMQMKFNSYLFFFKSNTNLSATGIHLKTFCLY